MTLHFPGREPIWLPRSLPSRLTDEEIPFRVTSNLLDFRGRALLVYPTEDENG